MKDNIYKFLDEHYPIDREQDNLIDVTFHSKSSVIFDVFGTSDIGFSEWVNDRCGTTFGYKETDKSVWYKNYEKHRDNDLPAIINLNGTKHWYQNGEIHRDNDKPAIIDDDGYQAWYQHGKKHRDGDKPAVIWVDGDKWWFQHGERYYPRK